MDYFRQIILLSCLIFAMRVDAATLPPELMAKMKPIAPCAAVVGAAKANHIPLEQIDPPSETNILSSGDSVTALVTLCGKGGERTQWIIYIEAMPDEKESATKPREPAVLYSSFGGNYKFISAPAPVKLRTLGPFAEIAGKKKLSKREEVTAQFSVNRGYLGLGLEQAVAVMWRLKQTKERKGNLLVSGTPFDESVLVKGRALAKKMNVTPTEERALVASVPTLISYVGIIQRTEGLNGILSELVELPSVWSMVRHGGVNPDIRFEGDHLAPANARDWNWSPPGDAPMFYFPMRLALNGQPALNITLLVTSPRPPLLACGGVIGLLAEKVGDNETYMTLRIISAKAKPRNEPKRSGLSLFTTDEQGPTRIRKGIACNPPCCFPGGDSH